MARDPAPKLPNCWRHAEMSRLEFAVRGFAFRELSFLALVFARLGFRRLSRRIYSFAMTVF